MQVSRSTIVPGTRVTGISVKKIAAMIVFRTLNQPANIVRGVFNNILILTLRYKAAGIHIALKNLDIEMRKNDNKNK